MIPAQRRNNTDIPGREGSNAILGPKLVNGTNVFFQQVGEEGNSSLKGMAVVKNSTVQKTVRSNKTILFSETSPKASVIPSSLNTGGQISVAIAAYMRTGSTFFGEAFNNHADVFYIDEPLHFASKNDKTKKLLAGVRNLPKTTVALQGLLSCDYKDLDTVIRYSCNPLLDRGFRRCKALHTFLNCTRRYNDVVVVAKCPVQTLHSATIQNICRQHKIVVGKVLWAKLKQISLLLDKMPNLRVIHLIRDPRGIANSMIQSWAGPKYASRLAYYANTLCYDMLTQYKYGESVLKNGKYASRYMQVRYEDLASDPRTVFAKVYDFIGHHMDENVARYIDSHTHGTSMLHRRKHDLFTYRENSTKTAEAWKKELGSHSIQTIEANRNCREFLQIVGYKLVYPKMRGLSIRIPNDKTRINSPIQQKPIIRH